MCGCVQVGDDLASESVSLRMEQKNEEQVRKGVNKRGQRGVGGVKMKKKRTCRIQQYYTSEPFESEDYFGLREWRFKGQTSWKTKCSWYSR